MVASRSDQLQFFNSQGYLVIESFSSSEEVEALRKRMDQLLDGFDCSSSTSIFSTKNQQRTSDDYFYDSADKISFFFEELTSFELSNEAIEDLLQVLSIKSLTELEGTSQDGGTEVQVSTFAGNF
ncbi:hypothetical protein LXL04_008227 [Taraxacum kok-saghyz]